MAPVFRIALLAGVLFGTCCASTPMTAVDEPLGVVIVRHAEKSGGESSDPGLSAAGQARAQALARRLADRDIVAVYATQFRRTQDTALPTALRHGLTATRYDAAMPAREFVDTLRHAHVRGTVLVVGHSDTVPALVSVLCGCAVAAIDETVYDRIYDVRFDAAGAPSLREDRY